LLPAGLVFSDTPSRAMAYVLDSLVLGAIGSVPLSILGLYQFSYPDFPDRNSFAFAGLLSALLNVAYFVWFWSGGRRATPGQRVFDIQVGNAFDGQPLSVRQAVIRWIALGFWPWFLLLLPFKALAIWGITASLLWSLVLAVTTVVSPTKQGIHDQIAGSALVRPARAGNRWAAGCLGVFIILALFEGVFLAWSFTNPTAANLPTDFWDSYLRWLWPS
jgi:uncharacterized RDD family membrane protein YckC